MVRWPFVLVTIGCLAVASGCHRISRPEQKVDATKTTLADVTWSLKNKLIADGIEFAAYYPSRNDWCLRFPRTNPCLKSGYISLRAWGVDDPPKGALNFIKVSKDGLKFESAFAFPVSLSVDMASPDGLACGMRREETSISPPQVPYHFDLFQLGPTSNITPVRSFQMTRKESALVATFSDEGIVLWAGQENAWTATSLNVVFNWLGDKHSETLLKSKSCLILGNAYVAGELQPAMIDLSGDVLALDSASNKFRHASSFPKLSVKPNKIHTYRWFSLAENILAFKDPAQRGWQEDTIKVVTANGAIHLINLRWTETSRPGPSRGCIRDAPPSKEEVAEWEREQLPKKLRELQNGLTEPLDSASMMAELIPVDETTLAIFDAELGRIVLMRPAREAAGTPTV
jgi:hypothetical protein